MPALFLTQVNETIVAEINIQLPHDADKRVGVRSDVTQAVARVLSNNMEFEEFLNPACLRPMSCIKRDICISFLAQPIRVLRIMPSGKASNTAK